MNEMRIYVASLSDYNDGRLEGKWFDLADYSDASELMEAIQEMLDDLTKKYNDGEVREEWAVHDYEGIPSTLASEYMGEQDFQQLYDIAEVADDRGIPVEVLVERAGDTGSDDYQALADSLMFVVDGNDESDIVYEYEEQLGGLGNDFWSNHIYIDDVTERVMYGEDVDRFREDILYENPDLDEDEAERQAEEMADEEAERREDLTTYLEDMGYGDEIPNWVSKDYEGAWKRSLSYDFDVIHHDGEMYVFSNNYSLGGTILSGVIGAYIGYKVGRAKPQKKGFSTEKRIGRKIKGAFSKKKMAKGGRVEYVDTKRTDKNYFFLRFEGAIGSFAWIYNGKYNEGILYPLDDFDKEYYAHIKLKSGEKLYRYATERMSNSDKYAIKPFGDNRYLIKLNLDKGLIYFMSDDNDPNDDKNVRFDSIGTKADYIVIDKEKFAKGGGIGFKALSNKVAKRYEGKKPSAKYRAEYGKRYSKSEAKEVGDKVAGKVYWSQKNKMALGGKTPMLFKGYTINFIRGEYRADAYGNPQFSDKNLAKLKQKINSYLRGNKFADGGGVENNYNNPAKSTHVLHIDGHNWYLEKIDSTHFYMSNSPNYRGMAHHIGQHRGEPYYEEVREWLKSTFSEGGGVDSITPSLNKKVVERTKEIYRQKGGKSQKDFLLANNQAIEEFGYIPEIYHRKMNEIGAEFDESEYYPSEYAQGGGVDGERTFSVYELAFGQPYNFYNEKENRFIWGEPSKATLYTKDEAVKKREELLKPRIDYYQRTGNNYKEIHIGDLSKKGFKLYADGGGISGLNDLIRG